MIAARSFGVELARGRRHPHARSPGPASTRSRSRSTASSAKTSSRSNREDEIRSVVITGRGRGFCSGGDQDDIIKHLLGKDAPALLAFTAPPAG